jgi:hypothetical protein
VDALGVHPNICPSRLQIIYQASGEGVFFWAVVVRDKDADRNIGHSDHPLLNGAIPWLPAP